MSGTNISVAVSNDQVRVAGGSLHGETLEIDFVENVVHVIDGEQYVCKTIYGERVLVYTTEVVHNYLMYKASFINI
jgi:hypothetical protein